MKETKCYDLFITHAWRFHDDWTRLSNLLDKTKGVAWRNFSLPWHDPAMNPNSKIGGQFIRSFLETQIIPSHAVVLLTSVYLIPSARLWFELEVEMAQKHNKPIVGLPLNEETLIPDDVSRFCDACCSWDSSEIFSTIDQVRGLPKFAQLT